MNAKPKTELNSFVFIQKRCKGAVIKYGTEGGGRDLTGSAKLLDEKCWASKIFQVVSMGLEGIFLQYFKIF